MYKPLGKKLPVIVVAKCAGHAHSVSKSIIKKFSKQFRMLKYPAYQTYYINFMMSTGYRTYESEHEQVLLSTIAAPVDKDIEESHEVV